jgi:hypothetical protein
LRIFVLLHPCKRRESTLAFSAGAEVREVCLYKQVEGTTLSEERVKMRKLSVSRILLMSVTWLPGRRR